MRILLKLDDAPRQIVIVCRKNVKPIKGEFIDIKLNEGRHERSINVRVTKLERIKDTVTYFATR